MRQYYITIFSIASITTALILLASQTLVSTNDKAGNEGKNHSNSAIITKTTNLQSENRGELANESSQKNQWRQQLPTLQQELKKYQKNGDIQQEINTLSMISIIYNNLSEYPKALESLQLAQRKLNLSNMSAEQKSFIEAELLIGMGTVYADSGNYPQALEITRKTAEIGERNIASLASGIGDVERMPKKKHPSPKTDVRKDAHTLYTIAIMQQKRGKISEALHTSEEILRMLRTVEDQEGEKEITKFINTLRQQL
jgi:tetratricopeptide (TPR) repeat protein